MRQLHNTGIIIDKIDPFFLKYLSDIGITTQQEIETFLCPQLSHLPDPFSMDQMNEAAELLSQWVIEKKPILIWGDYDVDGITGSAILFSFLQQVGADVSCHIPDRVTEGYGVNREKLAAFAADYKTRNGLLITVDCGMSNRNEIHFAREAGFTVIVTDHHEPGSLIPENCCILNGKKPGCAFNTHQLAGVGTAFFLLIATRKKLAEKKHFSSPADAPNLKQYLALTALGTVADMVPITRTNRVLIKAGFEVLSSPGSNMTGLKTLLAEMDLESGVHCADEISFKLAPVINAAGRIGDPQKAFELFTTNSPERAKELVDHLISLNNRRKSISKTDFDFALSSISVPEIEQAKCIITYGPFNQGLTGITASRLVEQFGLPAMVFAEVETENKKVLKGSCRSIDGIDILELIKYASKFTLKFGGHQGAAGITLEKQHFEAFKLMICDGIQTGVGRIPRKEQLRPYEIPIDHSFTEDFLQWLTLLEPTGEGVPKPEFIDTNATVVHSKLIGQENEHLQLVFRGQFKNHRGVGFHQGHQINLVNQGQPFTLTYTPYLNKYNKIESWQVMVNEIKQQ